jgi:hypothetical protein
MRKVFLHTVAVVFVASCGAEPNIIDPDTNPVPTTISVQPTEVTLDAVGATEQLTATVKDQNGRTMTGAAVTWVSSALGVATVAGDGLVTALGEGTAEITASSGSATASVAVAVTQVPAAIVILAGNLQTGVAGHVLSDSLVVQVVDRLGTGISGQSVTFVVSEGGGSVSPLSGTTDVDGRLTVAWSLGTSEGAYEVTAAIGNGTLSTVFSATITVGAPSQIVILEGDGQTAPVRTAVDVAPSVVVMDEYDNLVSGALVTFAVASGGGVVDPATAVGTNADGIASVTSWTLGSAVGDNTLTATVAGLDGSPVTFTAWATLPDDVQLVRVAGNGQTGTVGEALPNAIVTKVADGAGTGIPGATILWMVIEGGGSVQPVETTTDAVGQTMVSWTLGLTTTRQALGAILQNKDTVVFNATAVAGAATKLSFGTAIDSIIAGVAASPAVRVMAKDSLDNTVAAFADNVVIAITHGTGTPGAMLMGTTAVAAAAGTATFSNLTVNRTGTGYSLTAAAVGLESATSNTFAVTPGTPAQLAFVVQPANVVAGVAIEPAVEVNVQDAYGNVVTSSTLDITMGITSGTGSPEAVLAGTLTRPTTAGVSTFSDLSIDKAAAGYTLSAMAASVSDAISNSFIVDPGDATQLAFLVQPSDVWAEAVITPPVQVGVQDAYGNLVASNSSTAVTLGIAPGTGTSGALLSGTIPVTSSNGVATFRDLSVDREGLRYGLLASAAGLVEATSTAFLVRAFSLLALNGNFSCGLVGGAAYCWGHNVHGQLGDGTTTHRASPAAVTGGYDFEKLGAGGDHACGLTADGEAYCWGYNAVGQLGDGTTTSRLSPVRVIGGLSYDMLAAGDYHVCGLSDGGQVFCWGNNQSGQLGDSTTTNRVIPTRVAGGLSFTQITARGWHSCGLTIGGRGYCWGDRYETTPTGVSEEITFSALASGGLHTCGLASGGQTYCWGENRFGQLGDGTLIDKTTPTSVIGSLVFTSLTLGSYHTCGLTAAGDAYCWGHNSHGQLGDGTTTDRTEPTAVNGSLTFTQVSAGNGHTCGLTGSGSVYCWGSNLFGQLGDATTTHRSSPVHVVIF